jgi:hypothetical protein
MKTVRLTIKNYRGFSDQAPARIEIGMGLTSLLGPNNAGKSSLKLLFYELRELFEVLLRSPEQNPSLFSGIGGSPIGLNLYPGTSDPNEIFNNTNNRNISFELEVLDPSRTPSEVPYNTINRLVAVGNRHVPNQWTLQCFSIENPDGPVLSSNGIKEQVIVAETGGRFLISENCLKSSRCFTPLVIMALSATH